MPCVLQLRHYEVHPHPRTSRARTVLRPHPATLVMRQDASLPRAHPHPAKYPHWQCGHCGAPPDVSEH